MRKGQILYTYLHLAANKACTEAVMKSGTTAIAYETVEVDGQLPLLAPMSEVAGRMSIQVGAAALEASKGGAGVLLGGVPGVRPGKVVVIGGGVVGVAAATIAHGMRADVTIMDLDLKRLAQIDQIFGGNVKTLASSGYEIEKEVMAADLVVGAVLVHGAKAPKLVSNALVKKMKPGAVLVDVAIDQGGCFEDSKATTHQDPTYKVHDAIFYCVANMPGAVPATSTYALANATIKYGLALANKGWQKALADDANLAKGLNVHEGKIMYEAVAKAHNL
jgi:alanine dehydrogenase